MPTEKEIQRIELSTLYEIRLHDASTLYAVIKAILKINGGLELGGVRKPLADLIDSDMAVVEEAAKMIRDAIAKYL